MSQLSTLCFLFPILWSSHASAQTQDLKISTDQGTAAPGMAIPVNVELLPTKNRIRKLPDGYSSPTAFYMACTAKDETSHWKTGLGAEVFCNLTDSQTKIFHSQAESVEDIASGSSKKHTFAEKVTLPEHPIGTKLWVIVRLDYNFPGLEPGVHQSLYGSTTMIYRCEQLAAGKAGKVNCSYYTPGAYAAHMRTKNAAVIKKP